MEQSHLLVLHNVSMGFCNVLPLHRIWEQPSPKLGTD